MKPVEIENAEVDYKYEGFDMSKTHDQEETNKEITEHNKNFLLKNKSYFNNLEFFLNNFDCWKGVCFLGRRSNPIQEFSGWTSLDILNWLIQFDKDNFSENKNEEETINNKEVGRIITKEKRYKVLKRQGWVCNECGTKLKFSKNSQWEGELAHIDHIFPYSKRKEYPNGEDNINELENLQALCPKCNQIKRDKNVN